MRSADEDGNDRALIERFLGGDDKAFETLMDRYYERIDRLALRLVGDGAAAAEIAQEAFVRAYRALPRFRGDASLYSWLYRITVNLCLTHLRRRAPVIPLDAAAAVSAGADPAARLEAEQRQALVRDAVDALPPHYRVVILLSSVDELSYQEIASLLAVPVGTVKSRINSAKRLLREKLRPLLGPSATSSI
jgi:RNA polymerase sigma-70 factor (ECF subfamily)